jgi:hypothetical protein
LLDHLLEARECTWHAGPVLLAKLGSREATVDHRQS